MYMLARRNRKGTRLPIQTGVRIFFPIHFPGKQAVRHPVFPHRRFTQINKLTLVAVISGLTSTHCYPDPVYTPDFNSFDIVTDPRSIAMGESTVADAGNSTAAFSSNPATLASVSRPGIHHGYRSYNWFDDGDLDIDGLFSWSFGVVSPTRLGKFGFSFNRIEEGTTSVARFYGQTFFLAYATSYGRIGAGSVLKMFNRFFIPYSDFPSGYNLESTYTPALDLGLLYHAGDTAGDPAGFSIGIALQNISPGHPNKSITPNGESESNTILPIYLRAGFKYALNRPSAESSPPLRFLVTGEYRRFLNPEKDTEFTTPSASDNNSAGFGFELTLYEWLSLRTGWIHGYGDQNRFFNRYGLGINLSSRRVGLFPGKITFHYSPIRPRIDPFFDVETKRYVHSFGMRLLY